MTKVLVLALIAIAVLVAGLRRTGSYFDYGNERDFYVCHLIILCAYIMAALTGWQFALLQIESAK